MSDLEIVDAHHHLTDLARSYPWLDGPLRARYHGNDLPLRRSYSLDDYLEDVGAYRLIGSVHVENGAADPWAEATWIDSLHTERGLPSVQVAQVSLLDLDAPAQLDRLATLQSVRGIRDILNWHNDPLYAHRDRNDIITDPRWRAHFALLHQHAMSFDLQVFPSQLLQAAELAAEFPETRIILDHAGMPINRDLQSISEWRQGMRAVAAEANVFVKISALGTNDHRWTIESLRSFVIDTIEIFGPKRTMFGSNFPVDSLYSGFDRLYEAFEEITSDLPRLERQALFSDTAMSAYKFVPSRPVGPLPADRASG
ncbi:amidohydrolase family protein [Cryobacterium sp. SO2]|uniref:amidohydrolase family protein n=1 Tax=Cryobacterium sp. SO2 TaxID=1897060 RepID=UPI00223D8B43|nr:amidohydrolase family protein [Cryobacterium sp. SO2]WEO76030.1 amidohydrolase family protein [Cryobacterium sp. SO2]